MSVLDYLKQRTQRELATGRKFVNNTANFLRKPAPQWAQRIPQNLNRASNALYNAPTFKFAERQPTPTRRFVAGAAQQFLNIPSNTARTVGQAQLDAMSGQIFKPQVALRDVAAGLERGLDIGSFMGGGRLVKQGFNAIRPTVAQLMKQGFKTGVRQGAGYGAGYGVTQGLQGEGDVKQKVRQALQNIPTYAGGGAAFGGALGGLTPAASALFKSLKGDAIRRFQKPNVESLPTRNVLFGKTREGSEMELINQLKQRGINPEVSVTDGVVSVYGKIPGQTVESRNYQTPGTLKEINSALPAPGLTIKDNQLGKPGYKSPLIQEARKVSKQQWDNMNPVSKQVYLMENGIDLSRKTSGGKVGATTEANAMMGVGGKYTPRAVLESPSFYDDYIAPLQKRENIPVNIKPTENIGGITANEKDINAIKQFISEGMSEKEAISLRAKLLSKSAKEKGFSLDTNNAKSQLTDIWNKSQPLQEGGSLIQEARKGETLYHGTNYANARQIQKEGLNPETAGAIQDWMKGSKYTFLTGDEKYAQSYGIQKGGGDTKAGRSFVLAIKTPKDIKIEPSTFKKGMKFPDLVSQEKVSPENIFIKGIDDKWYPIKEFNFFTGELDTFIGKKALDELPFKSQPLQEGGSLIQEARKFKTPEEFIANQKGSATQYGDYTPQNRLAGLEGHTNITKLGINPNEEVTIYRGIDDITGKIKKQINEGDFVTTDFDSALSYAGSPEDVVSMKVKAKDLFVSEAKDFADEPFYTGAEYVYTKQGGKIKSSDELTAIWKEANKSQSQGITPTIPKGISKEEFIDAKIFDKKNPLPTEDITGFKNSLSKTDLSNVNRLEEIEYRKVALDKKAKPFKISKEDVLFYKENIDKYRNLSIKYFDNARQVKSQLSSLYDDAVKGITPKSQPLQEGGMVGKLPINTKNFNISEQGKKNLDETVNAIKPELEQVKGKVLKNEDVVDAAKASKILSREIDVEQTKRNTAAITRLRQEVAAGAEGKGVTKDFIENLKVLKSYSADAGRKLQAFSIQATPETSIKESVIADLVNLGKKSDEIINASKGVDFDNPKQVTEFYRQFVKPKMGEILDEYRYINLLSSPRTHIVNAFSNLVQGTVVNPATKLYSGAVDFVGSALTGKARQSYIGEVPAYTKGFVNSMGDAFKEAAQVFKGNKFVERPDINRIPTGKMGPGNYVLRALEAGDVFFRKLIKGGEIESLLYNAQKSGKKVNMSVIEKKAEDAAEYFVFRKAMDSSNKTGQGALLSGIDKMTEAVYKLRKVPGVNWLVPFVQTPMNILKQGLEYSPAGFATLVGNTNKTTQIAKALMGSTVLAGASMVVAKGDSTWAAPTGAAEKTEFYASGRTPYSIKIGNNWYSYSKLGPLAYPIAMAAAVKWNFEQNPNATSTDTVDKVTKTLAGVGGFLADQSYLTGLGDLLDIARGDEYAIKKALANFGRQLVPLASLQGWVARQLDPVFRQGKTFTEQLKTGIPGLSKQLSAYTDPLGNPSVRQNNTFNSFSPIGVTPSNQNFENIYQHRQTNKRSTAEAKSLTEGTKNLPNGKVAVVINSEVKTFANQRLADLAVAKEQARNDLSNGNLSNLDKYPKGTLTTSLANSLYDSGEIDEATKYQLDTRIKKEKKLEGANFVKSLLDKKDVNVVNDLVKEGVLTASKVDDMVETKTIPPAQGYALQMHLYNQRIKTGQIKPSAKTYNAYKQKYLKYYGLLKKQPAKQVQIPQKNLNPFFTK